MKHQQQRITLQRTTSSSTATTTAITTTRNTRRIIPSNYNNPPRPATAETDSISDKLLIRKNSISSSKSLSSPLNNSYKPQNKLSSLFRSFLNLLSFPTIIPTCKWLTIPSNLSITPSLGRKVTGTLFGHRRGHVSFAVQLDPCSEPLLLLELAMSTSSLVKEMSSGLVRIALECEKIQNPVPVQTNNRSRKLFQEPSWTMYCNGRKCGYAVSRTCGDFDWHVLSTVQNVSVGAGVIPVLDDGSARKESNTTEGELLYMRARFERVVGSRDSEAFYMLNPDGNGGPELSIFLLRI
ncbi:protein MIZU-KUSSEI 1 [Quillaja saponaria]|uniref:Protein MIZU-KUSSEI 1 n=1 Tax=Quillaja saponaria TaxID=32244 RepID=A0AAD7Q991_QUISA|nr:protein MIZU-KUSSEI 1 [Quillaja saponaria]